MATLSVIGSSSDGNSYILSTQDEQLIVELGVSWDKIMRALNYDLARVNSALVTHSHLDHSKSIPNALKYGLSVYSCEDVQSTHKGVKVLKKGVKTRIGKGFVVQPIPLQHSVETYGYLITHTEFGKLLFITDTSSFPHKLNNVNVMCIEANYSEDIAIDNMCNGFDNRSLSANHLEINDTIDAIKRNYSPSLNAVVLLHLSSGNSNAKEFEQRVKDEIGFNNVYVADSGIIIDLNQDEF